MFDKVSLINKINKSCHILFTESTFYLSPSRVNRFSLKGNVTSIARNIYNNHQESIDVIKWFGNIWISIEIRFENSNKNVPNVFISISIFQGEAADDTKKQLFRAEWDNFQNNDSHPQPHWHIYSDYILEESFNELAKLDEEGTFLSLISEEKAKGIDIKRIHFAMNGNWYNNGVHIHTIEEEDSIVSWFRGVLSHIKTQLEYVL